MIKCKGTYFRSRIGIYFNKGDYVQRKSLKLLKRLSCKGCGYCEYERELLQIVGDESHFYPNIEDNYIYKIFIESEDEMGFKKVGRYFIEDSKHHKVVEEYS